MDALIPYVRFITRPTRRVYRKGSRLVAAFVLLFLLIPIMLRAATQGTQATYVQQVLPAESSLQWANPANIPFDTPLGATQLNAVASVAGSFSYSPAAGTVLQRGVHKLFVTFTPSDRTSAVQRPVCSFMLGRL